MKCPLCLSDMEFFAEANQYDCTACGCIITAEGKLVYDDIHDEHREDLTATISSLVGLLDTAGVRFGAEGEIVTTVER